MGDPRFVEHGEGPRVDPAGRVASGRFDDQPIAAELAEERLG
jgi:hypothetical protein